MACMGFLVYQESDAGDKIKTFSTENTCSSFCFFWDPNGEIKAELMEK